MPASHRRDQLPGPTRFPLDRPAWIACLSFRRDPTPTGLGFPPNRAATARIEFARLFRIDRDQYLGCTAEIRGKSPSSSITTTKRSRPSDNPTAGTSRLEKIDQPVVASTPEMDPIFGSLTSASRTGPCNSPGPAQAWDRPETVQDHSHLAAASASLTSSEMGPIDPSPKRASKWSSAPGPLTENKAQKVSMASAQIPRPKLLGYPFFSNLVELVDRNQDGIFLIKQALHE